MLAITINNNFLKIAAPARNLFQKIPLDSSLVDDCVIVNPEALAAKIKEVLKEANIADHDAVVGLNEERTYLKEIFVPAAEKEIEPFIVEKLSELIPFDEQEVVYTYKLLARDKRGKILQVTAVEKRLLESYTQTFGLAGLSLVGLVPLALSLANIVPDADQPDLVICLEDNELVYILVSSYGGVSFSATYTLEKDIKDSKSAFVRWTNEVLQFSGERVAARDITKIFVCGENEELIREYLGEIKLMAESLVIDENPEFVKAVSLLHFDDPDLTIRPNSLAPKHPKLRKLPNLPKLPKFPKLPKRLPLLLGIFGLLGLVLAALVFIKSPKSPKPPETPAEVTEVPETTPSAIEEPTTEEFDKSAFAIQVLNAKGVQGVAARARDKLEELGYQVVDIDNTSWRLDSLIKVKEGNEELLKSLTEDLEGEYNLVESEILEEGSEFDAVVIIGSR